MQSRLPIYSEIEYQDPIDIFSRLHQQPWAIMLDSANHQAPYQNTNRYSYIAYSPFKTILLKNAVLNHSEKGVSDPFALLKNTLAPFELNKIPNIPPFQGGMAGYFSYDICHYVENIPFANIDDMDFPDLAVGLYDCVISFDHHTKKAWVVSTGFPETDDAARKLRAETRLEEVLKIVERGATEKNRVRKEIEDKTTYCNASDIKSNFTREAYLSTVQAAKDYILEGDIFEVNISQRFQATLPDDLSPFKLYTRLREVNPAPFAAYLQLNDTVIASASPERFILLEDKLVQTRPIKGTMPRSQNPDEDVRLSQQLLDSEKDKSENIMIVDLMRNDLSRVCKDDSVEVTQLCGLESFATVHHLVSVVKGELNENTDAIDLLKVSLPGGSITGAPKIRSMEIISKLEPNARGPYCGNIGYVSFSGDMDTSIVIRTYAIKNKTVTFQAGGAIVLDSDPAQEYQETLDKATALRRALVGE